MLQLEVLQLEVLQLGGLPVFVDMSPFPLDHCLRWYWPGLCVSYLSIYNQLCDSFFIVEDIKDKQR